MAAGNTVLLGVAQARDVEFEAAHLGDWVLHCHLPHHMMNQMVSMVGPMQMRHGTSADAPNVPGFRRTCSWRWTGWCRSRRPAACARPGPAG